MPPLITAPSLRERFWTRVDMSGGPVACWPWTRSKTRGGYGSLGWKVAPSSYAHVVAYVLTHGPLPSGSPCVLHSCDNPACCNPSHLRPGTKAENSADMVAKRRSTIGVINPSSKLTDDQVRDIRASVAAGGSREFVARQFGINRSTVSLIVTRRRWAHVE